MLSALLSYMFLIRSIEICSLNYPFCISILDVGVLIAMFMYLYYMYWNRFPGAILRKFAERALRSIFPVCIRGNM